MSGTNNIILQPRDLHLLRELSVMRVIDREQAIVVAPFGSTSRANARLLSLFHAGLIRRFFLGSGGGRRAIYALSPKGAQLIEVPLRGPRRPQGALLVLDNFVQHQLIVNALYCAFRYRAIPIRDVTFHRWESFYQPMAPNLSLIPDGYVEFFTGAGTMGCFIEVDLGHESLSIWKGKVEHYVQLALSGAYREQFGKERFRVLVLANSERRMHSIRKTVAAVTEKLFWFGTLAIIPDRLFDPVWHRPSDETNKSLFENT